MMLRLEPWDDNVDQEWAALRRQGIIKLEWVFQGVSQCPCGTGMYCCDHCREADWLRHKHTPGHMRFVWLWKKEQQLGADRVFAFRILSDLREIEGYSFHEMRPWWH